MWQVFGLAGLGTARSQPARGGAFVVVVGIIMALPPSLGHLAYNLQHYGNHATETPLPLTNSRGTILYPGFPAGVLFNFRFYSVAAQLILWTTIGLLFGPMAERVLQSLQAGTGSYCGPSQPKCDQPPGRRTVSDAGPVQLDGCDLLDGLAGLGPYFAVGTHRRAVAAVPPWIPLSVLLESPAALGERVTAVRAALAADRPPGAVEFRVAVSVTQLGLVSRLLSPAIAVAAAYGRVLELDPGAVWWQAVLGGPFPLSLPADAIRAEVSETGGGPGVAGDPGTAAGLVRDGLLDGPVRQVVELSAAMSVSRVVLWGNVASAINGATAMIARARPGLAGRALVAGAALLEYGPLAGASTGTLAGGFRRRSCCLIYRASPGPRGAVCGDCVLART